MGINLQKPRCIAIPSPVSTLIEHVYSVMAKFFDRPNAILKVASAQLLLYGFEHGIEEIL